MNNAKIQKYILERLIKNEPVQFGRSENKILLGDSYHLFIIREKEFFLKYNRDQQLSDQPIDNFLHPKPLDVAYFTGTLRQGNAVTGTAIELKSGTDSVFIPEKSIKYFDKDCTFRISDGLSPVYVYEHDEIVGIIMSVINAWMRA